jgi:hypothetical protein
LRGVVANCDAAPVKEVERGYRNMLIARAAAWVLSASAVAALCAGCVGERVSADAPAGLSLAGSWRLDAAASDDPQKVLAVMREQAAKIINRNAAIQQARIAAGAAAPNDVPEERGPRRDPLHHSQMAHVLQDVMARGEYLIIHQGPEEIVFDYGTSRHSFTPGAHSVVSSENGVADQKSGWNGRAYVIVIKPQMGPAVTDSYALSGDGRRLVETLHIASYELPAQSLTRVYEAAASPPPRQLPTD